MNKELSDFAARLRNTIQGNDAVLRRSDSATRCPCQELEFNSLALELFALQFKHNVAYRRMCERRHLMPNLVEHWTQIPAVPTAAFKELELSCISPEERIAVFHSSGTTEQKPSRHFQCAESLAVYEASLWTWFERNVRGDLRLTIDDLRADGNSALGSPYSALLLAPPPDQVPHSSLVHMFETIRQNIGAPTSVFVSQVDAGGTWALDFDAALAALQNRQSSTVNHRQLIMGTAFSFVHLLDFLSERDMRFQLPPGSRVMETGGYKNRSRTMPKEELHALITERLGIPNENIICEYGMSELSSQAYAMGALASRQRDSTDKMMELAGETPALPGRFCFPPWARVQIISPETGREVADGETGLIRVFDLANVFSVMAVQTEDLGVRCGNGFELLGRAQMAEPRGCSLMAV